MDAENLSELPPLFSYMKSQFDFVLIVSHNDFLKDTIDNCIEIKKINGFSKVEYI
jgi:DNA repair exonuclease SbcCD ATPase subunit